MFLNRLRQSYAFNILCICGLLVTIWFAFWLIIGLLTVGTRMLNAFLGILLIFHIIGMIFLIIFLTCFLIFSFELIFSIKISSQKFLCNKKITIMQNIGIIAFILIVIFDLIIFGSRYIELILNNLKI